MDDDYNQIQVCTTLELVINIARSFPGFFYTVQNFYLFFFAAWLNQLKQIITPWEEALWFTLKDYMLIRISEEKSLHTQRDNWEEFNKRCFSELGRR